MCSKSCDGGKQSRRRYCNSGDLNDCTGESFEREVCNDFECPTYGLWSDWSVCSKSCDGGNQYRNRRCSSGMDSDCIGNGSESQKCSLQQCPDWNEWQEWEGCTVTCGKGTQNRFRGCSTGLLVDCFGDSIQQESCFNGLCPTTAPKTISTLPLEENRFAPNEETFAPTPPNDFVNIQVEEFNEGDDLYQSALNGFDQFGGSSQKDNVLGQRRFQPTLNYDQKSDYYDSSQYDSNSYYSNDYSSDYDLASLRPTNPAPYIPPQHSFQVDQPMLSMPFKNKVPEPKLYEQTGHISCWRCDGSSSWEHCWSEGEWEDCQGDQGTCQVTVRRRGTDFWINTSCKQTNACEVNKSQNFQSKTPNDNQCNPSSDHSVCRQCCYGNGCNHEWAPTTFDDWYNDHSPLNSTAAAYTA